MGERVLRVGGVGVRGSKVEAGEPEEKMEGWERWRSKWGTVGRGGETGERSWEGEREGGGGGTWRCVQEGSAGQPHTGEAAPPPTPPPACGSTHAYAVWLEDEQVVPRRIQALRADQQRGEVGRHPAPHAPGECRGQQGAGRVRCKVNRAEKGASESAGAGATFFCVEQHRQPRA